MYYASARVSRGLAAAGRGWCSSENSNITSSGVSFEPTLALSIEATFLTITNLKQTGAK